MDILAYSWFACTERDMQIIFWNINDKLQTNIILHSLKSFWSQQDSSLFLILFVYPKAVLPACFCLGLKGLAQEKGFKDILLSTRMHLKIDTNMAVVCGSTS